jgi:hypothetical protein
MNILLYGLLKTILWLTRRLALYQTPTTHSFLHRQLGPILDEERRSNLNHNYHNQCQRRLAKRSVLRAGSRLESLLTLKGLLSV